MRSRLLVILASSLCVFAEAVAQAPRPAYIQFNKAVDEIHAILRKTPNPTAKDVAQVAVIGCNALTMLLDKDPQFKADIEAMAAAGAKNQAHHRRLADDLVFFVDSFVDEEHRYLVRSGMSAGSTADILIASALVRSALREPLSARVAYADIEKLRDEVCRGAKRLADAETDRDAYEVRKRKIRRWALGLGGVSLITADALFAIPSGGTASASFTLGGASVGAAIAQ
jgi:hypothetical protein